MKVGELELRETSVCTEYASELKTKAEAEELYDNAGSVRRTPRGGEGRGR